MSKITFSEDGHVYRKDGEVYTSVTTVLSKYKPKFEREHWAAYSAMKRLLPDFKGIKKKWEAAGGAINNPEIIPYMMDYIDDLEKFEETIEIIKKEWLTENKKAVQKGTVYHLAKEDHAYDRGFEINPFDGKKYKTFEKERIPGYNEAITENLYDLEKGYYPELLIWNDNFKIAGQADKVFVKKGTKYKYVDIDDWKTNKKMSKRGFYYKNYGTVYMLPPISHIESCNFNFYELQLSMYAYLLEQFGFRVRHLAIHHLNKKHDMQYRKAEIEAILAAEEGLL